MERNQLECGGFVGLPGPGTPRRQEGEVLGLLGWTRDGKGSLAQDQLALGLPREAPREAWSPRTSVPEAGARLLCTNRGSVFRSGEEQGAALNGCPLWKFLCICNNKITIICSLMQLDQSSIVPGGQGGRGASLCALSTPQPACQPVRALEISMQMVLIRWASCQAAPLRPRLCEGPDSPAPAPAHPPRSSQEGLRGAPPD